MKLQNPFDRLKKSDFVPLSLFPANKMTRTSMQIGRAVPVYVNHLAKNNKIKLGANQLTRFATMVGPVMSNFEVNLGYFFCPYVALDGFFENAGVQGSAIMNDPVIRKRAVLDARKFFNPATDDADRVHPMQVSVSRISPSTMLNGSLFDHLGYIGNTNGIDWNYWTLESVGGAQVTTPDNWMSVPYVTNEMTSSSDFLFTGTDSRDTQYVGMAYSPMYYAMKYWLDVLGDEYGSTFRTFVSYIDAFPYPKESQAEEIVDAVGGQAFYNWCVARFKTIYSQWIAGTYTGKTPGITAERFLQAYDSYIKNLYVRTAYRLITPNAVRYLTYMRIYADYFLDHHFTPREDFLDTIGGSYLDLFNAIRNEVTEDNFNFDDLFIDTNTGYHDSCVFFQDYLRNGECLPVLWQKDSITSVVGDDHLNATPIGSTVEQNFYNRMYARFKDLIARLGTDYKVNTDELYGGSIPDATLKCSQVVGFDKFAVNVGDIAQTGGDSNDSNLGDFAGYALSKDSTRSFEWQASEPGVFMVIAWVRPTNVAYINHLDRDILKSSYFDYLLPQFGGVGYQNKYLGEIYPAVDPDGRNSHMYDKFGNEERYSEYMYVNNECSGLMATTHDFLHVDRDFSRGVPPVESGAITAERYITPADDINRIFKDRISDPVLMTIWFHGNVTRQLPATIQTDF